MTTSITWPPRFAPNRVAARVRNEITLNAPPGLVWACLVRATAWPVWYPNSADVRIEGGAPDLFPDAAFTWRTFGVTVRCHVREFEPPNRIAWDGDSLLLEIHHAWVIEPRPGGSWVLTEEHQNGLAARAQALLMPQRMFRGHALWLERLKRQVEEKVG